MYSGGGGATKKPLRNHHGAIPGIATEVNKKLDEAENVVLSPDEPLEEGHITSSSSESEAESVELEAPVKVFHPPSAPEGFRFV